MVEVRDVTLTAGGARILDGVSARFEPGRFNVILGPNGAGKSSLLRVATGRLRPDRGEVLYDGCPVEGIPAGALARRRAVLSQQMDPAFPLSVREVVMMGRYPHFGRVPSARDHEIVERAIALVDMTGKRQQAYPTLSGGERQKVQLARALAQIWNLDEASGPRCLFLDEPTASLDIHYQMQLLALARELLAHECTVVSVLHDLNLAFQFGDVFFVLGEGRLAFHARSADDVPPEVIERVFRVRVHRVPDPAGGRAVWRFSL